MMEDQLSLALVNDLIYYVSGIDELQLHDGTFQEFPNRTIASFHNHLGNVKQFVSDEDVAFNAAEQFLSLKSAINEVQAALEDLFLLHHKDALGIEFYRSLEQKLMAIDESLRSKTDTDYTYE